MCVQPAPARRLHPPVVDHDDYVDDGAEPDHHAAQQARKVAALTQSVPWATRKSAAQVSRIVEGGPVLIASAHPPIAPPRIVVRSRTGVRSERKDAGLWGEKSHGRCFRWGLGRGGAGYDRGRHKRLDPGWRHPPLGRRPATAVTYRAFGSRPRPRHPHHRRRHARRHSSSRRRRSPATFSTRPPGRGTDSNTASNSSDGTEVEGTSLPNTGMNSGLLTLLGAGCIAVGALAIRRGRHWRSAR